MHSAIGGWYHALRDRNNASVIVSSAPLRIGSLQNRHSIAGHSRQAPTSRPIRKLAVRPGGRYRPAFLASASGLGGVASTTLIMSVPLVVVPFGPIKV